MKITTSSIFFGRVKEKEKLVIYTIFNVSLLAYGQV